MNQIVSNQGIIPIQLREKANENDIIVHAQGGRHPLKRIDTGEDGISLRSISA
jgi:hypothetical protein